MSKLTVVTQTTPGTPTTDQVTVYADSADGDKVKAITDAAVITTLASPSVNVKDKGAKGDGLTATDGAITSGLAVLTSASALFTAADAGKTISVAGAGGTALTKPGAPTLTAIAGVQLPAGTYKYMVTFISAYGETDGGTEASVATSAANLAVSITNIPTGAAGTLKRRVYRTLIGGATGTEKLLTEIFDNTTTTYTDAVVDAVVTNNAAVPTVNWSGASLYTTILTYTSATQVTLNATASATVTAATLYWGTDDTTAIQSAITALGTTGGEVEFPPGTYMVSKAAAGAWCINLANNITLNGAGGNATIIRMAGNQAASTRIMTGTTVSQIRITEIQFDGNRWNQQPDAATLQSHAIFLNSCNNVRIDNCYIRNTSGDGVQMYALPPATPCDSIQVINNRIADTRRQGVAIVCATNVNVIANRFTGIGYALVDVEPDSDTMTLRDINIIGNHLVGYYGNSTSGGGITVTGRAGVDSENFRRVAITGNIIDGGGTSAVHGISVEVFTEFAIANNTIRLAGLAGIFIRSGRGAITGNTVRDVAQQGISISQYPAGTITPSRISVTGNLVEKFSTSTAAVHGISCSAMVDSVINGNVVYDSPAGVFGIYLTATSLRNVVSSNLVNNPSAVAGGGAAIDEDSSGNDNTIANNYVRNYSNGILTVGAATRIFGNADAASQSATFTAPIINLGAGTTTVSPLKYQSGTNMTTPVAGVTEFDGAAFYTTSDTTNGRRVNDNWNFFKLTANGTPFTAITDFFGTNDGIPTVLNGVYEVEWHCYFAIATLSTQVVTWTIVNTQTVTNMVAGWAAMTALANGATQGVLTGAAVVTQTAASVALPATGVITIGNHYHIVKALIEAGTAGNVRLRAATASTATIGALRGSYFKMRRLPAGNAGTFVA